MRVKAQLVQAFVDIGDVDVVFANAGVSTSVSNTGFPNVETDVTQLATHRQDPDHPEDIFMTNGISVLNTLHAAMPHLAGDAHVLVTSSLWSSAAIQVQDAGDAAYAAAKAVTSRLSTGIKLGDSKKLTVLSPDFVVSDMVLHGIFRGANGTLDLRVAVDADNLAYTRRMFSHISRDDVVHQLQSPASPDVVLDPYDPMKTLQYLIGGLSAGFYSFSLKTGYVASMAVQSALDKTELVYSNPNYNMFVAPLFGGQARLADAEVDPAILDVSIFGEHGNLNAPLADDSMRVVAQAFTSELRRIAV